MFDCPEHNHTSPINTLASVTSLAVVEIVMVWASKEASGVESWAFHAPISSARVVTGVVLHEGCMVTVSLAVALPHIDTWSFCCNTILSLKRVGNDSCAKVVVAVTTATLGALVQPAWSVTTTDSSFSPTASISTSSGSVRVWLVAPAIASPFRYHW